jgi:hypothetical protein
MSIYACIQLSIYVYVRIEIVVIVISYSNLTIYYETIYLSDVKEQISKNNVKLAQEIFKIMDGPGLVSEILVKTYNNHPGTNNFGARLNEAKRIHYENRFLASRLDNVQPYYQFTKLQTSPRKKQTKLKTKPKSTAFKRKNQYTSESGGDNDGGGGSSSRPTPPRAIRTAPTAKRSDYHTARKQVSSATGGRRPETEGGPAKPKNLIMEHWKIQDGRVLDVAVLKEPFEDRFSLLGIDVDDGQRYQLSLSSEEVSNILEGDMLVTSFDNHNVWLALIEKVSVRLRPVPAFVKPGSAPVAVTSVSVTVTSVSVDEPNSLVSSLTGPGPHQDEHRDMSLITQEDKSYSEDWGTMPAIDVPISSYVDPDYLSDAFEDGDGSDDGDGVGKKPTDAAPAPLSQGEGEEGKMTAAQLPVIANISISAGDDSSGVEAAPPPSDFPLTRPSRPLTAGSREGGSREGGSREGGNREGGSTEISAEIGVESGGGGERGERGEGEDSARAPPPAADSVAEESTGTGGSRSGSRSGSRRGSGARDVSIVSGNAISTGNSWNSSVKMGKDENTSIKPAPPVQPKEPSAAKRPSQAQASPRKSMAVRRHPRKESGVVDVPWNSNVLVTKVRERMAEISAVEQEILVKRRATEYKHKKDKLPTDNNESITSEGCEDTAGNDNEGEAAPDSPAAVPAVPAVSFKPEPPSQPRPSAPPADSAGSGSFKSARGRRPTGFPPKGDQSASLSLPAEEEEAASELPARDQAREQEAEAEQDTEATRAPSPVRPV